MNTTTPNFTTWTNEQLSNAIHFAYRTNTADQRTVAMQKDRKGGCIPSGALDWSLEL